MNDIQTSEPITDLAGLTTGELEFVPEGVVAKVEEVMTSNSFLPRLQLNSSNTKIVQEGKSAPGIFCLVHTKEKWLDLGKEVVFLAISVRPKALQMPDQGNPVSYYDPKSEDFQKVCAAAAKGGMNGNMFGPEFLIWVPAASTFATFFHASETLRRVAPSIVQLMRSDKNVPTSRAVPAVVRGKMKFIDPPKSSYSWWGCVYESESSPIPPFPEGFKENLIKELDKFNHPPKSEVEQATEPATSPGRDR